MNGKENSYLSLQQTARKISQEIDKLSLKRVAFKYILLSFL